MAAHTVTGKYLPPGINDLYPVTVQADTEQALANTEVLTVKLPANIDAKVLPVLVICFAKSGDTWTRDTDIGVITDFDESDRNVRITAAGAVASGSRVLVVFVPND
jgi:hypothetical protein